MKIVFIGAGNLAFILSKALQDAGLEIIQVYSRTEESAKALARLLDVTYTTDIGCVTEDASMYIVSVSDSAIEFLAEKLTSLNGLVVHTAGSVTVDVFAGKLNNYGVLYPLQTFSKKRTVDFSNIPVFIEANSHENLQTIRMVAETISQNVFHATSEQRMKLHLAAVFGCNFVNHLYSISSQLAQQAGFDLAVLSPLILETACKAIDSRNPNDVQTGPAKRNDRQIMSKHMDMLEIMPEWRSMYNILSENIKKTK